MGYAQGYIGQGKGKETRDKQEAKRAHREWEGVGDGVRRITIILFKNGMI